MLGLFAKTFFLSQNKRTLCNKFSQRIFAFFAGAEGDESRFVLPLCLRRNMINHAPTAGAWRLVAGICRIGVGIYELNLAEVFCPKFYSCESR